jgi:hypothetical protein
MDKAQQSFMDIRTAIHNSIWEAERWLRQINPRVETELLLKLDRIEIYAYRMLWYQS